jgi:hypothetical protein
VIATRRGRVQPCQAVKQGLEEKKMIRYKDKVYEDYFIDPVTAVVTDKNGNIVRQYYNKTLGYMRVRIDNILMYVHGIQAHTAWGYKEGNDVHHKDHNKLNNAVENLDYTMTHEEHASEKHSDETKKKISSKLQGNKNALGYRFSEEAKKRLSIAQQNRRAREHMQMQKAFA